MIRKIHINIDNYLNFWVPPKKRLANRFKLLKLLHAAFYTIVGEWLTWRNTAITRANVSCETMSIEWYLNQLYDTTLRRIYITTNDAEGVPFGLSDSEPTDFQEFGLSGSEPSNFIEFPLEGEAPGGIGTKSFGVFIPVALASREDEIRGIVNIYKLAGKTFTVIQF